MIHFVKHLLGICGEPHPSILFGGFGFITMIGLYLSGALRYLTNIWRNK